jgi:hypothetical protein
MEPKFGAASRSRHLVIRPVGVSVGDLNSASNPALTRIKVFAWLCPAVWAIEFAMWPARSADCGIGDIQLAVVRHFILSHRHRGSCRQCTAII